MGETTYDIIKNYTGADRTLKLRCRVEQLDYMLERLFLETFFPPSQPAPLTMIMSINENRTYLAWAKQAASTDPEIKSILEELQTANRALSSIKLTEVQISASILPEIKPEVKS